MPNEFFTGLKHFYDGRLATLVLVDRFLGGPCRPTTARPTVHPSREIFDLGFTSHMYNFGAVTLMDSYEMHAEGKPKLINGP